jgi:hypothetical protein
MCGPSLMTAKRAELDLRLSWRENYRERTEGEVIVRV